jgi:hypothetical protein
MYFLSCALISFKIDICPSYKKLAPPQLTDCAPQFGNLCSSLITDYGLDDRSLTSGIGWNLSGLYHARTPSLLSKGYRMLFLWV